MKFTKEQAIVITGYTGITACHFFDFHNDIEERLGQPVYHHQFADKKFVGQIKELYREDFLAMIQE